MRAFRSRPDRRLFAPEVIQTSAMDCGPAALKCLLEGYGVPVSYGRLREACQTDVDGTSIDTIEEIAVRLGLAAEQIMVPADHLLLPEAKTLPALVVVIQPNRATHFVVVWRRLGPLVQVMDPASGRHWTTSERLLQRCYRHSMPVPADAWREWAGSGEFLGPLRRRLMDAGYREDQANVRIASTLEDQGWHSLATLDAATRLTQALLRSDGLPRGSHAVDALEAFYGRCLEGDLEEDPLIPGAYWSVRPASHGEAGEERLSLKGVVLVRVGGLLNGARTPIGQSRGPDERVKPPLSRELVAALEEPPPRPGMELLRLLRADGLLAPAVLLTASALAAGGVVVEALFFRGLLSLGAELGLLGQRLTLIGALLALLSVLLLLDLSAHQGVLRTGRRLEALLRITLLRKIPRLSDRYFQSRPTSDMAERSHNLWRIRLLPTMGWAITRRAFEIILTFLAITWLSPASAPFAALATAVAMGWPILAGPLLVERDLRLRTLVGSLGRFYLDALLGLVPIRAHTAERAVQREHEDLLGRWAQAGLEFQRTVIATEGLGALLGFTLAVGMLLHYLARGGDLERVLLLAYWSLNLPWLGQELALIARRYPHFRNLVLRMLEPLGALEEPGEPWGSGARPAQGLGTRSAREGASIVMQDVHVRAAGHTILHAVNLRVDPGSHIAIVGPSGAGKSTLVGLLLGWHRPAGGQLLVDGEPLRGRRLDQLRWETAWVDPAVQLWNRPLIENLCYGLTRPDEESLEAVLERAGLERVLESLPEGLQTRLGEGGALVSGGEGQRVRLGRAMLRPGTRLTILDEPFRGLDRGWRRLLLNRSRDLWRASTLFCITHDIHATQSFNRILVMEGGRIVEEGVPGELIERAGSRYRAMLEMDQEARDGLWSSANWLHYRMEGGRIHRSQSEGGG